MLEEINPDDIVRAWGDVPLSAGTQYEVWRHGGNSNHRWRLVSEWKSKQIALSEFNRLADDLRQGGAFAREPGGRIIAARSSPRLRTRW